MRIIRTPAASRLLIVYNADAGIGAGLLDTVHKIVSPATYPCSLCGVTYGVFGMDRRWRAWLDALPMEITFYYRPDFRAAHPALASAALPLIAREADGAVEVLLDAAALGKLKTADALMAALARRLD